jgi:N-methylhydantoinase B
LSDVLGGFVEAETAMSEYGVVIEDGRLNRDATLSMRSNRPKTLRFHRQEYVDAFV